MSNRYVVTEIEGYAEPSRGKIHTPPGLSVQVIDTLVNYRVMATFRSEECGGKRERARAEARHLAAVRCAELNGEPRPLIARDSAYQPTCRRCRKSYRPDQYHCACGMPYDLSLVA